MGASILFTIPKAGRAGLPSCSRVGPSELSPPTRQLPKPPSVWKRPPLIFCTYQHPCPQEQSIQDFSPAGPDLCLIRADRSPGSLLPDRFQRNPLERFCLEGKVGRGHRSFSFHTHACSDTRLGSYLIGRIRFKETSPVPLPNPQQ